MDYRESRIAKAANVGSRALIQYPRIHLRYNGRKKHMELFRQVRLPQQKHTIHALVKLLTDPTNSNPYDSVSKSTRRASELREAT